MVDKLISDFLVQFLIDHREAILIGAAICAKEVWEYWLGKTDKVEAGSSAELIILTIKKLFK